MDCCKLKCAQKARNVQQEQMTAISWKTMAWFRGFTYIYKIDSRSLLLFGPDDGGLRYAAMDGRIVEGSQVISADALGRAFQRGRFLRRAQRRFLRRKRRRRLTSMLLCLPQRLGQNTWLRLRQFTQRAATSFLQQVGQNHLQPLVSVVSLFVENTKMKHPHEDPWQRGKAAFAHCPCAFS